MANNTKYMFAEASTNEESGLTNTLLGDQCGYELRARRWYLHDPPWSKVFRFNDPAIAEEIATRMEKSITNGYVGYDQNTRNTLLYALLNGETKDNSSYTIPLEMIDAVHTNCCTDCSALAYTAIRGATNVIFDSQSYYEKYKGVVWSNNGTCPAGRQYEYYIERQCVNAGFDITVFTIDSTTLTPGQPYAVTYTKTNGEEETKLFEDTKIVFSDGTIRYFPYIYYNSPYDYYDSALDTDMVRDHLHVVYLTDELDSTYGYTTDLLNTFAYNTSNGKNSGYKISWLKRGDILRTTAVPKISADGTIHHSGHVAVWI